MTKDKIMVLADKFWAAGVEQTKTHEAGLGFDGFRVNAARRALQSAIEALQKDAERYRWLRGLQCNALYLTRNDEHSANYMTAADWISEHREDFVDDDPDEVSRMASTNTIWTLQIYPHTPIGFNLWHGSTPDAAIDAAMALDKR